MSKGLHRIHNKVVDTDPLSRQARNRGYDFADVMLDPDTPSEPARQKSSPVAYNTTAAYRRAQRRRSDTILTGGRGLLG